MEDDGAGHCNCGLRYLRHRLLSGILHEQTQRDRERFPRIGIVEEYVKGKNVADLAQTPSIWGTRYTIVLPGVESIVDWLKGQPCGHFWARFPTNLTTRTLLTT